MLKDFLIKGSLEEVYILSVVAIIVIAIFAFAAASIVFMIFYNIKEERSLTLVEKSLLTIVALALSVLSIMCFKVTISKTLELFELQSVLDRKIEEVYDVTKTGNQLIFNRQSDNYLFIEDASIAITNETNDHYTFVIRNHMHQIKKSVVTEK